jgi:Cu+-exporting ATPase
MAKKIKITIEGMHCASCASNIERSIRKVKGVKEVSVSVMTKKGFVEMEEDVKDSDIKDAVARTGYKVTGLEED